MIEDWAGPRINVRGILVVFPKRKILEALAKKQHLLNSIVLREAIKAVAAMPIEIANDNDEPAKAAPTSI